METVLGILSVVAVSVLVGLGVWIAIAIVEFIVEVPKQLKRIADALEKRRD